MCGECFIQSDLSGVLWPPIFTDNNKNFKPSDWLLEAIDQVVDITVPTPAMPLFHLVSVEESVQPNTTLLADYNINLTRLVNNQ